MSESRLFIAGQPTGQTIIETVANEKPPALEVIPAPAVVLAKPEEGHGT
jgi:hypothetical protein